MPKLICMLTSKFLYQVSAASYLPGTCIQFETSTASIYLIPNSLLSSMVSLYYFDYVFMGWCNDPQEFSTAAWLLFQMVSVLTQIIDVWIRPCLVRLPRCFWAEEAEKSRRTGCGRRAFSSRARQKKRKNELRAARSEKRGKGRVSFKRIAILCAAVPNRAYISLGLQFYNPSPEQVYRVLEF